MTTRIIRDPEGAEKLANLIVERDQYPVTVTITKGAPRRNAQNRLAFAWYSDIARDLGDRTAPEARAECKVIHGAPILCQNVPAFAATWERLRERFSHEEILQFVHDTELPITSLMTVRQMTAYLDAVQRRYTTMGVRLTHPDDLKYAEEM